MGTLNSLIYRLKRKKPPAGVRFGFPPVAFEFQIRSPSGGAGYGDLNNYGYKLRNSTGEHEKR